MDIDRAKLLVSYLDEALGDSELMKEAYLNTETE